MIEKVFDPTIHQDSDHLIGFKFRNTRLMERIEEFRAANSAYRGAPCSVLAERVGLAESTLKKLKAGQISDPRGSTYWLLWKAFGIDPRELLGIPIHDTSPPPTKAVQDMQIRAEEIQKTVAILTQQRDAAEDKAQDLRLKYLKKCEALSAAEATIGAMQEAADKYAQQQSQLDKRADDNRNDFDLVRSTLYAERAEAKRLRIALTVMCVVAIVALGIAVYVMWDAMHPNVGFFRA